MLQNLLAQLRGWMDSFIATPVSCLQEDGGDREWGHEKKYLPRQNRVNSSIAVQSAAQEYNMLGPSMVY